MTKVLFVGHFHEQSGWGQAAKDYALALDAAGVDVACRSLRFNNNPVKLDANLERLLSKSIDGCTTCIQNVLPHQMTYDSAYYNIGLWFEEAQHKFSPWTPYLKLMDELWVPNSDMSTYRDLPTRLVPVPYDFTKIKQYSKLNLPTEGNYTFYFIGELNKRKHLASLLRAFHSEFSGNEPVSLVLKTYRYGVPGHVVNQETNQLCRTVKKELGRYKHIELYNKEILITDYLPEEAMMALHQSCDCFVIPSFGEGWCIPAFDALAMGNAVIGSDVGGLHDFIPITSRVGGAMEPAISNPGFPGFGNCHETWFNIDVRDLMSHMRNAYTCKDTRFKDRFNLRNEYSYEAVGGYMKQLLEKIA